MHHLKGLDSQKLSKKKENKKGIKKVNLLKETSSHREMKMNEAKS